MNWNRLLASISGSVDQELLLRNEYLATENRILRNQIPGRSQLNHHRYKRLASAGTTAPTPRNDRTAQRHSSRLKFFGACG